MQLRRHFPYLPDSKVDSTGVKVIRNQSGICSREVRVRLPGRNRFPPREGIVGQRPAGGGFRVAHDPKVRKGLQLGDELLTRGADLLAEELELAPLGLNVSP